ncbi:MAG: hypothetical protein JSW68_06640, partial [Burkholderiales bacterium]
RVPESERSVLEVAIPRRSNTLRWRGGSVGPFDGACGSWKPHPAAFGTLSELGSPQEDSFPALAASRIDQVSLECANSHVPPHLMALLAGKDVLVGVIDVASDEVETPEQVADTIGLALQHVPKHRLFPCTNCGMAPMDREIARRKLEALAKGAQLARERYGE